MFWSNYNLILEGKAAKDTLVPLPQTNEYQDIEVDSIKELNIITAIDFDNKAVYFEKGSNWNLNLKISLKEINKTIDSTFSTNDYLKIQEKYLQNDESVNGNDKKIISIADNAFGKEKNCEKIIQLAYDFVLNYLSYGKPFRDLYPYKQALDEKTTDCGGYSTLLGSLLQSRNIPTRLVVGHLIKGQRSELLLAGIGLKKLNLKNLTMHAWIEALLPDGRWFPMDPSIEWRRKNNLTKRKGGFGIIPNDRLVVSFGRNVKLKVKNKNFSFPILQHVEEIDL